MMNILRGVGLAFFGAWFVLKNVLFKNILSFILMPWATGRRWANDFLGYDDDISFVRFFLPGVYSLFAASGVLITFFLCGSEAHPNLTFTHSWLFKAWYLTLPIASGIVFSGLYEIGRAYAPPAIPPAETNKEKGMNTSETKVDDPSVTSVARNAYEHEINGLRKAVDEDEGKIRFWKWLAIGTLSVVVLVGAASGYMLQKGIMTVDIDGVSLAQELEKAQVELERLKAEIPALEDAQKKLDEMMEKAKEMVPPGILPPEKEKKGDDF